MENEELLSGGNVNRVVRVGDTVRRPTGPWTPAVHSLLRHLETAGFGGAPRVVGTDDTGREVLTFINGTNGGDEMPDKYWSDECLVAVGQLIRDFHSASRRFTPPAHVAWRALPGVPSSDDHTICHNDLAPYNTIYRADGPVAFIDWDAAGPAPPIWDLAHAAWRYVDVFHGMETASVPELAARLRLLCDSYGLRDRSTIVDTILARQLALHQTIRELAEAGDPAFSAMWGTDHSEGPLNDAAFLRRHRRVFENALS